MILKKLIFKNRIYDYNRNDFTKNENEEIDNFFNICIEEKRIKKEKKLLKINNTIE